MKSTYVHSRHPRWIPQGFIGKCHFGNVPKGFVNQVIVAAIVLFVLAFSCDVSLFAVTLLYRTFYENKYGIIRRSRVFWFVDTIQSSHKTYPLVLPWKLGDKFSLDLPQSLQCMTCTEAKQEKASSRPENLWHQPLYAKTSTQKLAPPLYGSSTALDLLENCKDVWIISTKRIKQIKLMVLADESMRSLKFSSVNASNPGCAARGNLRPASSRLVTSTQLAQSRHRRTARRHGTWRQATQDRTGQDKGVIGVIHRLSVLKSS